MTSARRQTSTVVLLWMAPVAIVWLVYHGALEAGFVFDDNLFTQFWCWQVERPSELLEVVGRPGCSYRPIRMLSLALDHLFWGPDPFGYHLTNLLLHGINVVLVMAVLRGLGLSAVAASLAGLLWALHPVHTDVVTYVAGRRDLLSTLFFLAAFLVWPRHFERRAAVAGRVLATLVLFGLALGSKEMAVTLPAILLLERLYEPALAASRRDEPIPGVLGRAARRLRAGLLAFAAVALLAAAWVVYRGFVHPMTRSADRLWGGDLTHHVLTICAAYAKYAELILFPARLYGDYSEYPPASGWLDWRVWVGVGVLAAIWGGGLWLSRRRPYVSFGLFWFGLTLLPVSQIIPHHELLAEHYLYLPLVGLSVPCARGVEMVWAAVGRRRVVVGLMGAVAVVYAMRVGDRNEDFVDEVVYAEAILRHVPGSVRGRLMLANAEQAAGRPERALEVVEGVLDDIEPTNRFYQRAAQNRLTLLVQLERFDAALVETYRMIREVPSDPHAVRIMATIQAMRGESSKALAYHRRAVRMDPDDVEGHLHLGVTLLSLGRIDEAAQHIAFAVERWPRNPDAQFQWAMVAIHREQWDAAAERLQRVLSLDPTNVRALERLVLVHHHRGDVRTACLTFERLRELRADLAYTFIPECQALQGLAP